MTETVKDSVIKRLEYFIADIKNLKETLDSLDEDVMTLRRLVIDHYHVTRQGNIPVKMSEESVQEINDAFRGVQAILPTVYTLYDDKGPRLLRRRCADLMFVISKVWRDSI